MEFEPFKGIPDIDRCSKKYVSHSSPTYAQIGAQYQVDVKKVSQAMPPTQAISPTSVLYGILLTTCYIFNSRLGGVLGKALIDSISVYPSVNVHNCR